MPTETPQSTSRRTPPKKCPNDSPRARSSASSTAISIAAFAMWCPCTGRSSAETSAASSSRPSSRGIRWWISTCCAASTYSDEYVGSSPATHSPQPSPSLVIALTSRMSRSV